MSATRFSLRERRSECFGLNFVHFAWQSGVDSGVFGVFPLIVGHFDFDG